MAAPMWRMNGLWRKVAGVLVLCALLLSNEVMCQDDATATPVVPTAVADATGASIADAPHTSGPTDSSGASAPPGAVTAAPTIAAGNDDNQDTLQPTVVPVARNIPVSDVPQDTNIVRKVVPDVKCVDEKDIPSDAVKAEVETNDCETTKRIIQENPAGWCNKDDCKIHIFQDGKKLQMASSDATASSLAQALQSEQLKDKLGVTVNEVPTSSGSAVFVGILVSGLLAALGITVGYFKCQRRSDTKGVRLAEEAYPVDQENQGNTLVSVAPLNPPPETQEKPSINGESPEAAKTQPAPPTNGHSTTKTADTEL